ncbi:hypothetical protein V2J09_011966 [Rumex salicifolius]
MAFLANKNIFSQLRSHQPKAESSFVPHRGFHVELGEREKAIGCTSGVWNLKFNVLERKIWEIGEQSNINPGISFNLLAKDPALKRFKSHKKGVRTIKRMGDVLTIVVVASKMTCFNNTLCLFSYRFYVFFLLTLPSAHLKINK